MQLAVSMRLGHRQLLFYLVVLIICTAFIVNYRRPAVPYIENDISELIIIPKSSLHPLCSPNYDNHALFYPRIPKAGSTTILMLLKKLTALNKFVSIDQDQFRSTDHVHKTGFLPGDEDMLLEAARGISEYRAKNATTAFVWHTRYIDFESLQIPAPLSINVMRDPIDRLVSEYYYMRDVSKRGKAAEQYIQEKGSQTLDECIRQLPRGCNSPKMELKRCCLHQELQVAYLCGHRTDPKCADPVTALETAKAHLHSSFAVVGIMEEMVDTVQLFENMLPRWFRGASVMYAQQRMENEGRIKVSPSNETIAVIRECLKGEIELYHEAKTLFYQRRDGCRQQTLLSKIEQRRSAKEARSRTSTTDDADGADNSSSADGADSSSSAGIQ